MARPNLGVRAPLGLPPASAGRRGAGEEDSMGSDGVDTDAGGGVPTAASRDAAALEAFMVNES